MQSATKVTHAFTKAALPHPHSFKLAARRLHGTLLCLPVFRQSLCIMAPKQATLGKFFGAKASAPQQQSRLSFATKTKDWQDSNIKAEPNTGNDLDSRKRTRRAEHDEVKTEEGMEEDAPVAKRARRRNRAQIEDGEESGGEARPKVKEEEKPKIEGEEKSSIKKENKSKIKDEAQPQEIKTEEYAVPSSKKKSKKKTEAVPKSESIASAKTGHKSRNGQAKATPSPSPKEEQVADEREVVDKNEVADGDTSPGPAAESESESGVPEEIEDEEKPAVTAKAREKVQQTLLKIKGQTHFPDWEQGSPVPYAALCATFSLIEMTTKRLVMTEYCSSFLRQVMRLTPDDLLPTILLMINKLAPDYAGIELGIGESLIMKAIGETTGRSLQIIKADQKEIGDLGLVAIKSRSTQPTMFKPKPLTVRGVHKGLMDIATVTGHGAQGKKVDGIKKLLSAADCRSPGKVDMTKDKGGPSEAKFIVRFLEGKLRLGLAERTVLVSLAQAVVCHEAESKGKVPTSTQLENGESILKTVYSELPSYDAIIPALLNDGVERLRESCKLRPGVPLKPMLAKPTKAITEVLDRFEGQTFTCEYKYDGERAQIHYVVKEAMDEELKAVTGSAGATQAAGGVACIFSRNSEDLSNKYPDILAKLHSWVKPDTQSFVLDCETVAWDVAQKKVLPFQQLMTRKKKDVKVDDVKVKVCVFAFDVLYLNGQPVVDKTLRQRRDLLHEAFVPVEGEFAFAAHMDGQELDEIQVFLDESVKASCEGLMVKMLDGSESGYEPSKRSRNWLKIKKDYLSGVGDSLDLVVIGAYYGKGKRTSVYGAFLLACYNASTETYESICNIGTGFSEPVLEQLHAQLSQTTIARPKPFYAHSATPQHQPDVWLEPRFVWEVRAADLTLSPRYKAGCHEAVDAAGEKGISLRFPRFVRVRDDKKPHQATASRQVAEMYHKQESVAQSKGPAVDDDFEY